MRRVSLVLLIVLLFLPVVGQTQGSLTATSTTFSKANSATGTTDKLLAKITSTGMTTALTTDTTLPLYLIAAGGATTGTAIAVAAGPGTCLMDETNASGMAGFPIVGSTIVAGRCHAQATLPSGKYGIGYMIDDATTVGVAASILVIPQPFFPSAGAGITSLTVTVPAVLGVSGSPLTGAGTIALTATNQVANCVMAGPVSGSAAPWACRALVAADLPSGGSAPGGAAGGSLGGTYPNPTVVNAPGGFALTGPITPTVLSGNVNNYTPTDAVSGVTFANASVIRIDGGAADRTISGLAAGTNGAIKILQNVGTTYGLFLPNQSASSSATGRFNFGGDVSIFPGESQAIIYDATVANPSWRTFGGTLLDAFRMGSFTVPFGSPASTANALVADDDAPVIWSNDTGRDVEIRGVACYTQQSGPVSVLVKLTGQADTSVMGTALSCGVSSAWATASNMTGVPIVHSFASNGTTCASAPCTLDVLLSAVDGTTRYAVIKVLTRRR